MPLLEPMKKLFPGLLQFPTKPTSSSACSSGQLFAMDNVRAESRALWTTSVSNLHRIRFIEEAIQILDRLRKGRRR